MDFSSFKATHLNDYSNVFMPSLRTYTLVLLSLFLSLSHRSFAIDEVQDSSSCSTHFITVQEYCQCLMAMASGEDIHGLYDAETMGGEIVRALSAEDQQPHFLYGIAHGVDPQSPMLGLTELDAMRCCNWMETSLLGADHIAANTESGSYFLYDNGAFERNTTSQLFLLPHDDGTFEIISTLRQRSTSPLMIFGESGEKKGPGAFPQFSTSEEQTAFNRRESDRWDQPSMGSSLSDLIYGNNDDHDDSLIGHKGKPEETTNYIAIKDISFCCFPLPSFIKNCLVNEETRVQLMVSYEKIKQELTMLMLSSDDFKVKAKFGYSGQLISSRQIDFDKINAVLSAFDQSFSIYNLTRTNLKAFIEEKNIVVPTGKWEGQSRFYQAGSYYSFNNLLGGSSAATPWLVGRDPLSADELAGSLDRVQSLSPTASNRRVTIAQSNFLLPHPYKKATNKPE